MHDEIKGLEEFLDFDPRGAYAKTEAPSAVFVNIAQKTALETFQLAAKAVPAYKDFLKKHKVNPEKIKTFADFETLPLTDKQSYLANYPLPDLLVAGSITQKYGITSSSGSSGRPFYWPRFFIQDIGAAKGLDIQLVNLFNIDKESTLHVNCSGMGVWTAGDIITVIIKYLSVKYPHNSSISPGIDMENSQEVIINLAPLFSQTVIYGYPPFLKDLVDALPEEVFRKSRFKLYATGESFSESWRQYMAKKIGSKTPYVDVTSALGSSEGSLIGIEMANSATIREEALKSPVLCRALFNEPRIPSLIQYVPESKLIESVGGKLVFTNRGALPLIRYDTKDYGGVLTVEDIENIFVSKGKNSYLEILKRRNIINSGLPFVYLFGRSDYSASIYGVLVYPEYIKDALLKRPLRNLFSGKFALSTVYDKNGNQNLKIICELAKEIKKSSVEITKTRKIITTTLRELSSEYRKLWQSLGRKVEPSIVIKEFGDKTYFSSKNKQKYILKQR